MGGSVYETGLIWGGNGTIHLGAFTFCAINQYRSDSGDDGLCHVYQSGIDWYMFYTQQAYVACGAICI
jgi:hypothetical protein